MQINMKDEYTTRDGRAVKILAIDTEDRQPVVALVDNKVEAYNADGSYYDTESQWDLIPKTKNKTLKGTLFNLPCAFTHNGEKLISLSADIEKKVYYHSVYSDSVGLKAHATLDDAREAFGWSKKMGIIRCEVVNGNLTDVRIVSEEPEVVSYAFTDNKGRMVGESSFIPIARDTDSRFKIIRQGGKLVQVEII